jgi:hypothetical protein
MGVLPSSLAMETDGASRSAEEKSWESDERPKISNCITELKMINVKRIF